MKLAGIWECRLQSQKKSRFFRQGRLPGKLLGSYGENSKENCPILLFVIYILVRVCYFFYDDKAMGSWALISL